MASYAPSPLLPARDPREMANTFLITFKAATASDAGRAANLTYHEMKLDMDALKLAKVTSPGKATGFATAFMVQKAALAAGIATDEDKARCIEALGNLAGDLGGAVLLAPETFGVGSVVELAIAALDAYDVGNSCFNHDGVTTHAILSTTHDAMDARDVYSEIRHHGR